MSEPLWERLLVAATGPTVAALLGTLVVGIFLATRATKEADRREQATARRQFEFRQDLVDATVRAVMPLWVACRTYPSRQKRGLDDPSKSLEIDRDLDVLYLAFKTDCSALMGRLRAHYDEPELRLQWHAIDDLLTVRYYQVRGLATDKLLATNAGPKHSGLTVDSLRESRLIDDAVEAALERTTQLVVTGDLTVPA